MAASTSRLSLAPSAGGSSPASSSRASSQQGVIVERPYNKTLRSEVALSSYAFLISEMIAYSQTRVDSIAELETRSVLS